VARRFVLALLTVLALSPLNAQDLKVRLAEANSTEDCLRFAQRFRRFGTVRSSEIAAAKYRLFVTWTEPRQSDSYPSFVFGYRFCDGKWRLVIDDHVSGRVLGVRAATDSDRLVFFGQDGLELKSITVTHSGMPGCAQ
jgi:hypothetical protein